MKLRIRGNSIRFRLTQSEVKKLYKNHFVSEAINFSPIHKLRYSVKISDTCEIVYLDSNLSISIPEKEANNWIRSEETSFSKAIENGNGGLQILIEKDLKCSVKRDYEDDSDAFSKKSLALK